MFHSGPFSVLLRALVMQTLRCKLSQLQASLTKSKDSATFTQQSPDESELILTFAQDVCDTSHLKC